ncbi:putative peptidase, ThiJ/PfpI family [Leptospira ryugenii]|uniref:Putative peptidase, ThiJ/PfpI family n=1 Tax=Leptospira ryugenii TaxID=1917863 RepID=A0A2P2E043_9LEPT|nr:DJ-1 family glyoxalase III [Leptospira ryugenii]GBF50257.1 putative peptidase, ThiJ/PfpI family [Leptospira ryugenii]
MSKSVLIPLAPGFEEMEGMILTDVFRRGGLKVTTASTVDGPILASRKTTHLADKKISELLGETFDLIALPGGLEGTKNLMQSDLLKEMLLVQNKEKKEIAAICAAPNVLREWNIIAEGMPFTCFPTSKNLSSGGTYLEDRIVSVGHIHTSVGPGSAFEFALFLLERLVGEEIKSQVQNGLLLPK